MCVYVGRSVDIIFKNRHNDEGTGGCGRVEGLLVWVSNVYICICHLLKLSLSLNLYICYMGMIKSTIRRVYCDN